MQNVVTRSSDFAASASTNRLACHRAFAQAREWEGLVLKAYQEPSVRGSGSMAQCVKLKNDQIPGLADSADLVVIGGLCDPAMAERLQLRQGSWTTLYLTCTVFPIGLA